MRGSLLRRAFEWCRSPTGGLAALQEGLNTLPDGVGLLALGLQVQVVVPVLNRPPLIPGLLVGLPRQEVRLGLPVLALLNLRGGYVGISGPRVGSLALSLVRLGLSLAVVGLSQQERDVWVVGGDLAAPLQHLYRLVGPARLDVEAGEAPHRPGVIRVLFEVGPGALYLVLGAGGLSGRLVLAAAQEFEEVVADVRADAHKDERAHEDRGKDYGPEAGPEGD